MNYILQAHRAAKGFNSLENAFKELRVELADYIKSDCEKLNGRVEEREKPLKVTGKRYFVINGHKTSRVLSRFFSIENTKRNLQRTGERGK